MREKIRRFIINRNYNQISDIKLKELFLKVNKEDVINFCIEYINDDKYYEIIARLIGYDENDDNLYPINDKEYLSQKYDYFLELCKNNYTNELSQKYAVDITYGFPFSLGEFLSLLNIEDSIYDTDKFSIKHNKDNHLPVELFVDCRVSKCLLKKYKDIEIIGRFILQAIYIEENNKILSEIV